MINISQIYFTFTFSALLSSGIQVKYYLEENQQIISKVGIWLYN
jgi:hypothetical protein